MIEAHAHTLMVASSEEVTMTEKTGWKMTRVTGERWPLRAYLSGGRGIHSLGSLFWATGPPRVISSLASFSFDSSSITWRREGVGLGKSDERGIKRRNSWKIRVRKEDEKRGIKR
jgi:hypothetical protein